MSRNLRLSEKWFQRLLWLIAVIFAGSLIGLGSLIVNDLPRVEHPVDEESYMDQVALRDVRARLKQDDEDRDAINDKTSTAQLAVNAATQETEGSRETFNNWVSTREATGLSAQNAELIRRTNALDALTKHQRSLEKVVEDLQAQHLEVTKRITADSEREQSIKDAGQNGYNRELRRMEMRVFLLRLALTLPLLLIATFLFLRARKSTYWPFVWGFIFFAFFTFFFELVPYLPNYGGYVRYIVGILFTVVGGIYAIRAMRRYLERQRAEEEKPEQDRRRDLSYDVAQARLAKRVCPGCERPFDLADANNNVCQHCGLLVFHQCPRCETRGNVFSHFCRACGLQESGPKENQPTVEGLSPSVPQT